MKTTRMLKIDVDIKMNDRLMQRWLLTRRAILKSLGYVHCRVEPFTTKHGKHFYIRLSGDVTAKEANELQFMLGDDQTRVKINTKRIKRGVAHWNKLFHHVLYRKRPKTLACPVCDNTIRVPDEWYNNKKNDA